MVVKCRTVRITDGTLAGDDTELATNQEPVGEYFSLQNIMSLQRQQQELLFPYVTGHLRRNKADLERLQQLRQTAHLYHPPPWSAELRGLEKLLTSEEVWRQYERRHLVAVPSVKLPLPQEVDITLLTASLNEEQPMPPTPRRTCAQWFFPPPARGRLEYNKPRQRCFLPGTRLPNTVIIRLLWSTRTLLGVQYYRAVENRRTRRRQHWEFCKWSDSEEEEESAARLERLESVTKRRRHRRKISMIEHDHLESWFYIAKNGVDESAVPDSDDEAIAHARKRLFSRRGRLLSDAEDRPATEGDTCTPALSRFTCVHRPHGKQKEGEGSDSSLGGDNFSSGSSEKLNSDNDVSRKPAGKTRREQSGKEDIVRARNLDVEGNDSGAILTRQDKDRQLIRRHHQADHSVPSAPSADDQVILSVPGSTSSSAATGGGPQSSVPPGPPPPWIASGHRLTHRLLRRRPTRRVGSVNRSPNIRARMASMGGLKKYHLNTPKVRPDIEAEMDSVFSDRLLNRRHALRLPHIFEVKEYLCEGSKATDRVGGEKGAQSQGMKYLSCIQGAKQRMKQMTETDAIGSVPTSQGICPSRIPGIYYDANASDYNLNEGVVELVGTTEEDDSQPNILFRQKSDSSRARPNTSDGDSYLHCLSVDYIHYLMRYDWARELLQGINRSTLDPWNAAESMAKRMVKQPFTIQQNILQEVQTIHKTFPAPDSLQPVSDGILTSLYPATEDLMTLTMAMDTLVVLADQMDVVVANILALLPLDSPGVRKTIQSLLAELGLVDPHQLVLAEALSWAPRGGRRNMNVCRKEIERKALGFVGFWTQTFKAHSAFVAEEVNKRKMEAIVKYNIITILKSYEPHAIEETSDGFQVNLRKPSNIDRMKNPQVIEVLNYFVEMTDEEDEWYQARRESFHLNEPVSESDDPLGWRRENKDILVAACPSTVVQGNRPLSSGVLQTTALVTHWRGVSGLAPGPWPTVTVGIHLRIADKYYRGTRPVEMPPGHY